MKTISWLIFKRYGIALVTILVALAIRVLLWPAVGDTSPFLLFAPAVMISAWYGGLGPGLMATLLGALIGESLLAFSTHSPFVDLAEVTKLALFLMVAILTSLFAVARRRAEEERDRLLLREQNARAEAEAANRAKDEFLAMVSHELRNPISSILGWIQIMRKTRVADVANALGVIERNAKSLSHIIEDILDVSRVVTGKLKLDARPCGLVEVIQSAIDVVRPAAAAKSIEIRSVLSHSVAPVVGDCDRLQQVVWNLLSNAIKFTPSGGCVDVRLDSVESNARITVRDNGKGINAELLPYVFDRFRQDDVASTKRVGGLGLGLALVRHLVELHGGTVSAESQGEGQGATFSVLLPMIAGDSKGLNRVRIAVSGDASTTAHSLEGIRVLVVDDQADARAIIALTLESCGAKVTAAASAREALAYLETNTISPWPDVLVSDIRMPDVDGYELMDTVLRLEKEHRRKMPAVALTAYATTKDNLRAFSAGYQALIEKPAEPAELVKTIAGLIGRSGGAESTVPTT